MDENTVAYYPLINSGLDSRILRNLTQKGNAMKLFKVEHYFMATRYFPNKPA
jgi:hypothetical protein